MNRRGAIKGILALGAVGGAGYAGFRAFELHRVANAESFLEKKVLISALADTIIPTTNTPGAAAAKVEAFIISVLINCTSNVEQNLFLEGLEKVERYCERNFNRTFSTCTEVQRISILTHFENSELYDSKLLNKINNKFFGVTFFAKLKELTVQGYCNSYLGAQEGLAYNHIPGQFLACISLKPNQKSWATK